MGTKLAIGDFLEVPVKYTFNPGASKPKEFKFFLIGKRLDEEEVRGVLTGTNEEMQGTVGEFLQKNISDWRNQTLVLDDETGKPAPFSAEAFDAMLSVTGMAMVIHMAYLKEIAGLEKEEARRKN